MATAVDERQVDLAWDAVEGLGPLVRSLRAEQELLGELQTQLVEQRAGLAANDTAALEQVVQQIGRTLLTIREARRQRTVLVELIGGQGATTLSDVAAQLPAPVAEPFRSLCRELHAVALMSSRELQVNQLALRQAIVLGEQFLHRLLTAPGTVSSEADTERGMLLNQRA
ncbi:MAG: flagellar export chaperone FlgN [Gemmatimonadales bacterium]